MNGLPTDPPDPATDRRLPRSNTVDARALRSVATQFFVNGAMTASFVARLPEIRDRIDVTVGQLGLALTGAGVFGLLGSLFAGRVIERWSTRRVLAAGAVVMAVSLPVIGLATTPAVFLAGLLAYFLLDVLVDIAMNLQGSWISARRAVPVMNRLHGLWSLGTVAGGLLAAQAAAASVPLAAHLTAVAVASAAMATVVVAGLLDHDEDGHADTAGRPVAVPATRRGRAIPLVLLVLAGMFAVVMEQTGSDWAAFRLADDFGASAGLASLAYVAFTVGMTIVRFAGDWLQVRLGRDGLHRVALTAATLGSAGAALLPNRWAVLGCYLVAGAGVATFLPKLYDDAARTPGRRGAGLGALTAGTRIAGLTAPAVVGALAATSLSVGDALAIVTLPCAVAFALVTALGPRHPRG